MAHIQGKLEPVPFASLRETSSMLGGMLSLSPHERALAFPTLPRGSSELEHKCFDGQ